MEESKDNGLADRIFSQYSIRMERKLKKYFINNKNYIFQVNGILKQLDLPFNGIIQQDQEDILFYGKKNRKNIRNDSKMINLWAFLCFQREIIYYIKFYKKHENLLMKKPVFPIKLILFYNILSDIPQLNPDPLVFKNNKKYFMEKLSDLKKKNDSLISENFIYSIGNLYSLYFQIYLDLFPEKKYPGFHYKEVFPDDIYRETIPIFLRLFNNIDFIYDDPGYNGMFSSFSFKNRSLTLKEDIFCYFLSMIMNESNFNTDACSDKNALGVFQITRPAFSDVKEYLIENKTHYFQENFSFQIINYVFSNPEKIEFQDMKNQELGFLFGSLYIEVLIRKKGIDNWFDLSIFYNSGKTSEELLPGWIDKKDHYLLKILFLEYPSTARYVENIIYVFYQFSNILYKK